MELQGLQVRIWQLMTVVVVAALIAATLFRDPEDSFGLMTLLWLIHAVIAFALTSPIVSFGRRRAHWQLWELLAFIIPFSVWRTHALQSGCQVPRKPWGVHLPQSGGSSRSALRSSFGDGSRRFARPAILALLCLTAVAIYFLTPSLPE